MAISHGTDPSSRVALQVWRWIASRSPRHQRLEHGGIPPEAPAPTVQPNPSEGSAVPHRSMMLLFRMSLHEASVAVARIRLSLGTIEEISIDPKGGGCTKAAVVWVEEQTEERLTAVLIATLSGRAAEETIIGSTRAISGGTVLSDLARATAIAFEMEATAGFSRKWPLLHRPSQDLTYLLALDSEMAARINGRLEEAYAAARAIVATERATIIHLAGLLFEHEKLAGSKLHAALEEVRRLMSSSD
jgi:ATP-dependent Zn protease